MSTARQKIMAQIESWGPGSVFTAKDFTDTTSRGTVDVTLARMAEQRTIRKIGRGLFDWPRVNPRLGGELSPDLDQAARAIARKSRWTILPDGALAANQLGLSQQVPARIVYLSDGPAKTVKVGRSQIHFKHARPKEMRIGNDISGLVIQAMRYLGRDQVNDQVIRHLSTKLSSKEKSNLLEDTRYSTDWIYEVAQRIAGD
jgi:hypothetical protein